MAEIKINAKAWEEQVKKFEELTVEVGNKIIKEKTEEIYNGTKSLASAKVHSHSGDLVSHIGYKTRKKKGLLYGSVYSNAYGPKPKRPGIRNKKMTASRYKNGTPYPKILEFAPRFGHTKTTYSRYAHLYPVADRVKPTIRDELYKALKNEYDAVYNGGKK